MAARIAAPQHGVVARRQLLRAGLSRDQVDHLVAAGCLILLYRGVYAVGHRPVGIHSRDMAVALLARGPVDLRWPDHHLVAELDGYEFHHPKRAFETDRERDIVLATKGHRTVRVTHAQLERRATVAERFAALLSSRGR